MGKCLEQSLHQGRYARGQVNTWRSAQPQPSGRRKSQPPWCTRYMHRDDRSLRKEALHSMGGWGRETHLQATQTLSCRQSLDTYIFYSTSRIGPAHREARSVMMWLKKTQDSKRKVEVHALRLPGNGHFRNSFPLPPSPSTREKGMT